MLAHLLDVSLRSLLLALAAAVALWILRNRRTAALKHAVWAMVVSGMFALFVVGQALPRFIMRIPDGVVAPLPTNSPGSTLVLDEGPSAAERSRSVPAMTRRTIAWEDVAVSAYGVIAFAFLAQFVTGMFLVRKLVAAAHAVSLSGINDVFESERIAVPFTVGWLRPKILLPVHWRDWERAKLDAVLAHERAHVRRHDGLVAALAGLNRCIFWFHPLAWMLQRKLALLAEQACDESCLAELGDREWYARLLVEMASIVDPARGRLRYQALTMAAASHIHQRIAALLQYRGNFSRGLTRRGWAAVVLCATPVILGAASVGLDRQPPPLPLELPRLPVPAPPSSGLNAPKAAKPVQMAQAQAVPSRPASAPMVIPKWDSISIKPCAAGDGAGRSGRGGAGGRGIPISPPGEFFVNCMSIRELIDHYLGIGQAEAPLLNDFGGPFEKGRIRGGPSWIYSDWYTIDAKSSDPAVSGSADPNNPAARRMLGGPMLKALIESRFQLKTHREVEEIPMFSLAVANGGFKLQPIEEGACIPHEPGTPLRDSPGQKPWCITHAGWDGPNWTIDAAGQAMYNLAGALSGMITDRPVLDKTGITGVFSFHLVFAHDKDAPGMFPPGIPSPFPPTNVTPAPPLVTVLEQDLGLTLRQDKGPREYIVVDSADRPRE